MGPPSTSMSWLSTGLSASRVKAPFWCGATCSTSAAFPMSAALCSCVKTSWFPSTRSQASRCRAPARSQWGPSHSSRCSIQSGATPSCVVTVAVEDRRPLMLILPDHKWWWDALFLETGWGDARAVLLYASDQLIVCNHRCEWDLYSRQWGVCSVCREPKTKRCHPAANNSCLENRNYKYIDL